MRHGRSVHSKQSAHMRIYTRKAHEYMNTKHTYKTIGARLGSNVVFRSQVV